MQINGASTLVHQFSTDTLRRKRIGASPTGEPADGPESLAFSVTAIQVRAQTEAQTQSSAAISPVAEMGQTSGAGQDSGSDGEYSPPGGAQSNASELLRLLGAGTEGYNASASPNGLPTDRPGFFQEILKSFSDAGRANQMQSGPFAAYMQKLVDSAYVSMSGEPVSRADDLSTPYHP